MNLIWNNGLLTMVMYKGNETISIREERDGMLRAEWFPPRPGMPIVGRGATVLEAVGSLVIYDQVVALEPTPFVDTRFSCEEPACPRR